MFPWEIFDKPCCGRFCASRLDSGDFRCKRQTHWPGSYQSHSSPSSKVLWNIDFLDEAHGRSSRTVADFKGARLEQSLEG